MHAPILWRSELRSVLTGYLRDGSLTEPEVVRIMEAAESALAGREHLVPSASVFTIAAKSKLSAYDCELVALASALTSPLVTVDKAVLKAFPAQALTMETFLRSEIGPH